MNQSNSPSNPSNPDSDMNCAVKEHLTFRHLFSTQYIMDNNASNLYHVYIEASCLDEALYGFYASHSASTKLISMNLISGEALVDDTSATECSRYEIGIDCAIDAPDSTFCVRPDRTVIFKK